MWTLLGIVIKAFFYKFLLEVFLTTGYKFLKEKWFVWSAGIIAKLRQKGFENFALATSGPSLSLAHTKKEHLRTPDLYIARWLFVASLCKSLFEKWNRFSFSPYLNGPMFMRGGKTSPPGLWGSFISIQSGLIGSTHLALISITFWRYKRNHRMIYVEKLS